MSIKSRLCSLWAWKPQVLWPEKLYFCLQVHTFDPFLADNTEEAVKGRPGLQFHPVGILGSADGRVGTNSPERWQSLESMMVELGHEWLEVIRSSQCGNLPANTVKFISKVQLALKAGMRGSSLCRI